MSANVPLVLEEVPCNFCGSRDSAIWRRLGEWTVVECRHCRFRYTNPRPARACLASFYTEPYFQKVCGHSTFGDPGPVPADSYRIIDIEPWFEARGSLLELGAATGEFLKVMQDRGWTVRGLDISQDAVAVGRRVYGVDIVAATVEEFDTSERFDAVCLYHTLEHLPDPLGALRKARTWLRPSGVLVIEVPNAESFDARVSRREAERILDLPRHLNHFTPSFLSEQLKLLGFNILRCSLHPPIFLMNLLRWRELLRRLPPHPRALQSQRQEHIDRSARPLRPLHGDTWKLRLLQRIATVAPGWRFTVVARPNLPPC